MAKEKLPLWRWKALTSFPKSEIKTGGVRASTLIEADTKIRSRSLFPISITLAPDQSAKDVQAMAVSMSLEAQDRAKKLITEGMMVLFPDKDEQGE